MRNKYGLILLAILLLSFGCKKNTENIFTSSSYPLAVGNWWKYQSTDIYLGGGEDTFTLNVVSMFNVGPYKEYVCNVTANGVTAPAGYFLQSDTSMSFTNATTNPYVPIENFHLKFPVETGQYWAGAFPGDSIMVVGAVATCTDVGAQKSVGPCYITNESYDLPHNFKVERMTLTPNIGLIYQSINFNSDTAYNGGVQIQQNVTLISYHVQ